jgi:Fe-S oxidoreductase
MTKIHISEKNMKKVKLEKEKCIGCKLCMKGCPMLHEFCESPDKLLQKLFEEKAVDYKLPYSCLLCGYCTAVCPKDVDLNGLFFDLRKDIVEKTDGKLPKDLGYTGIKFHQKNSFSRIFSTNIKGLGESSNTIFFPGCSMMAYSPEIVDKTYRYLKTKMPGIGIYINCCGKPTISMGQEKEFEGYYNILRKEFKEKNIKKVITSCLNCYKTIGEASKDIEVVTLWEVLAETGIPENIQGRGRDIDIQFAIHDPCPTRKEDSIHNGVRKILEDIGIKTCEMEFSRGKTLCCGSGGMVGATNSGISLAQKKKRADQTKKDYIVTYCEECVESMKKGGKKSIHILDLLFNEEIYKTFNQEDNNLIKKWVNRYKGKKRFNNIKSKGRI